MEELNERPSTERGSARDSLTSSREFRRALGHVVILTIMLYALLLSLLRLRLVLSRKDTGVSPKSSPLSHYSIEQHLRVFALETVKGMDGGEENVSLHPEYQSSQETSTSGYQEEPTLNFRGNGGASSRNEAGGEEGGGGRDGSNGNGSGRRGGGGGGGDGGGGGGDGGGGGGDGDGEGSDLESRGRDKKKLKPPQYIIKLAIMSIAIAAQTSCSVIALQVEGHNFLTKRLLVLVMVSNVVGYLCSMISVLLMYTWPPVARVLGVTGCAATALGFLILIVTFIQGLYNRE